MRWAGEVYTSAGGISPFSCSFCPCFKALLGIVLLPPGPGPCWCSSSSGVRETTCFLLGCSVFPWLPWRNHWKLHSFGALKMMLHFVWCALLMRAVTPSPPSWNKAALHCTHLKFLPCHKSNFSLCVCVCIATGTSRSYHPFTSRQLLIGPEQTEQCRTLPEKGWPLALLLVAQLFAFNKQGTHQLQFN